MRSLALSLAAVAVLLPAAAPAQDFLGAFLQAQQDANIREAQQRAVMSRKNRKPGAAAAPAPQPKLDRRVAVACQEKARAKLRPLYEQRLAASGERAANAWLREAAQAEGRRMGARVAAGQSC